MEYFAIIGCLKVSYEFISTNIYPCEVELVHKKIHPHIRFSIFWISFVEFSVIPNLT